jgi:hypothetical protein
MCLLIHLRLLSFQSDHYIGKLGFATGIGFFRSLCGDITASIMAQLADARCPCGATPHPSQNQWKTAEQGFSDVFV